jgi:hypothetical protein
LNDDEVNKVFHFIELIIKALVYKKRRAYSLRSLIPDNTTTFTFIFVPYLYSDNQHCERKFKSRDHNGQLASTTIIGLFENDCKSDKSEDERERSVLLYAGNIDNRKVLWNFQNTVSRPGYTTSARLNSVVVGI